MLLQLILRSEMYLIPVMELQLLHTHPQLNSLLVVLEPLLPFFENGSQWLDLLDANSYADLLLTRLPYLSCLSGLVPVLLRVSDVLGSDVALAMHAVGRELCER